jgi:hypothetical protein
MKRKLYTKGKCTLCRGNFIGCPYCDSEGLTFVEALDIVIIEILMNVDEDLKRKITEKVLGINYEAVMDLSSSFIVD